MTKYFCQSSMSVSLSLGLSASRSVCKYIESFILLLGLSVKCVVEMSLGLYVRLACLSDFLVSISLECLSDGH